MSTAPNDDLVFKALADGRRREILDLLKEGPRTTGDLCGHFAASLDRCTVMQHLGVLERADLIVPVREGRQRWNHLNAAPFLDIQERWISGYASQAMSVLGRLRKDLEGA